MATQVTPEEVVTPVVVEAVVEPTPVVDHQQVPSPLDSFNIDQK